MAGARLQDIVLLGSAEKLDWQLTDEGLEKQMDDVFVLWGGDACMRPFGSTAKRTARTDADGQIPTGVGIFGSV